MALFSSRVLLADDNSITVALQALLSPALSMALRSVLQPAAISGTSEVNVMTSDNG